MPKSTPAGNVVDTLNEKILACAMLEQEAKHLNEKASAERAAIFELMHNHGLGRHATPEGAEALIYASTRAEWSVEKLQKLLDKERFSALCPPTPKAGDLKKLMEADATLAKDLKKCAKWKETESLKVTPPPPPSADQIAYVTRSKLS